MPSKLSNIFGSFSKDFWIVNSLELFERGAYYGMMSVLGVHVVLNLGIAESVWGVIYAFMIALLYFVPLISAALAEKYGYKKVLIGAFLLMVVGYSGIGFASEMFSLLLGVVFMGVGAGAFKPMISATIAHTTAEEKRNLAYSIYYWMINLGAFAFPLFIGIFLGARAAFYLIFFISAVFIGVNLAITLTMYRTPVEPKPELKVGKALTKIIPALTDKKFVILLLIYSGFWFIFAFNHTFLPIYMVQYGKMPIWFTVPLLATINPGTIITLGPFLGKLVEKYESLKVMITGILIFCAGLVVVAYSTHPVIFASGIIIFSIGEFIVHPNFISYVSKICPKDKVAIYMASIFIPVAIGNILGGVVHGIWYENFAVFEHRPKIYIANVAAVGAVTAMAFILYNRWRFMSLVEEGKKEKREGGFLVKPYAPVLALVLAPVLVMAGFAGGSDAFYLDQDDGEDRVTYTMNSGMVEGISGNVAENSQEKATVNLETDGLLVNVTFTLTWEDEPAAGPRYSNRPDTLSLTVISPGGEEKQGGPAANSPGGSGSISLDFSIPKDNRTKGGDWEITVSAGDCGDQQPLVSVLGLRDIADDGNSWSIGVDYDYLEKSEV